MKKSKRHIANLEQIDKNKVYTIEEAVALAKKNGGITHRDMLRKDIDSIIKN